MLLERSEAVGVKDELCYSEKYINFLLDKEDCALYCFYKHI